MFTSTYTRFSESKILKNLQYEDPNFPISEATKSGNFSGRKALSRSESWPFPSPIARSIIWV